MCDVMIKYLRTIFFSVMWVLNVFTEYITYLKQNSKHTVLGIRAII